MDPFWDDSAISLLTAECAAFLALGKDCFADVVRFQSSMGIYSAGNAGITTSFDKVMEEAAASRPEYCIENTGIHSGRIRIGLPAAFIHH